MNGSEITARVMCSVFQLIFSYGYYSFAFGFMLVYFLFQAPLHCVTCAHVCYFAVACRFLH